MPDIAGPLGGYRNPYAIDGVVQTDQQLHDAASGNYGWGRGLYNNMNSLGLGGLTAYGGFKDRLSRNEVDVVDGKVQLSFIDRASGITQESAQQLYEQGRRTRLRNSRERQELVAANTELGRDTPELSTASTISGIRAAQGTSSRVQTAVDNAALQGVDPTTYNTNMSPTEINGITSTHLESEEDKDVKAGQVREDNVTQRGREFQIGVLQQQQQAANQTLMAQLQFQQQDNKSSRDLQMLQMDYNNRRDERRDSRDRRQETLAMITSGLANLGSAFAY